MSHYSKISHYNKSKKVYPESCKSSEAAMTLLSLNNSVVKEPYIIDTMKIKYKQLDHAILEILLYGDRQCGFLFIMELQNIQNRHLFFGKIA
jgi:hypothetical protein